MASKPDISICIPTAQRAASLERLLKSIVHLRTDGFTYEVIIVDDAFECGRPVALTMQQKIGKLRYFVEPRKGIPYGRNLCVNESHGDWIAFVDDDESVDPEWLIQYWKMAQQHDADGFFGPQIFKEETTPPKWLIMKVFFYNRRHPTGTIMKFGYTLSSGNTFLKRSLFQKYAYQFDPVYSRLGEDTKLYSQMVLDGRTFIWCEEAIVTEFVDQTRLTFKWLWNRRFYCGYVYTQIQFELRGLSVINHLIKPMIGTVIFAMLAMFGLLAGRTIAVKWALRLATQIGHLKMYMNRLMKKKLRFQLQ